MDKLKKPEGDGLSFPEGVGCKFFQSEGGYPPHPIFFSAVTLATFDSTFLHYIPVCVLRSYYMDENNIRKVPFYVKTVQNLLDVFVTKTT